jgi:hypothetical protein
MDYSGQKGSKSSERAPKQGVCCVNDANFARILQYLPFRNVLILCI